ncbi:class II aldolase/adducin family protein [Aquisediminimonas profunda]|uniref:class II aldolase/adducin family protein n=1 Tax=Aquisediminimonas profunda TaxID=1550733 RepID=UPI001C63628C|nr:class II aldolase/adducin family protein [Aquisediminimonas profunda]
MTLANEASLREDLAAAFRLAAKFGWHESVGNHFSAAVSEDGHSFLLNRKWQHFASIRPSDLLLLNATDPDVMNGPDAPDASAWTIHGTIHRLCPNARVVLHCHPIYSTALAMLADPELKPLDNNTARYFNRVAIDRGFGGIADEAEEGLRLVQSLGNHKTMLMGNHGLLCAGETVAEAFENMYFFERAAQTQIIAYSTGKELAILSDEIAEKTAQGWDPYRGMADAHFSYLKSTLEPLDG